MGRVPAAGLTAAGAHRATAAQAAVTFAAQSDAELPAANTLADAPLEGATCSEFGGACYEFGGESSSCSKSVDGTAVAWLRSKPLLLLLLP